MDDKNILKLYWSRSEQAIEETDRKYGHYCYQIAYNILGNREESEERVSDAYLAAWNHIPPEYPHILSAYLGKITRNLALKRWRSLKAEKRGGGQTNLALEELDQCLSDGKSLEEQVDGKELAKAINQFLDVLEERERSVFLCRYWYFHSIEEIAQQFSFSKSKVTSMLYRTRGKLQKELKKEGLL